jgi:hypothetical protein
MTRSSRSRRRRLPAQEPQHRGDPPVAVRVADQVELVEDAAVCVPPVVVLRRPDDRLQAYARGVNNALWEVHQTNLGIWSSWASLGGRIAGAPSAASAPDGRIVVYARGTDNRVVAYTEHAANSDAYFVDRMEGGIIRADPVATAPPTGPIVVYVRGLDNRLYRFIDDLGSTAPVWQYNIGSDEMVSRPGVGFDGPYARVFMAGAPQGLFASRQLTLGGPSARWTVQRGLGTGVVGDPAVTQDSGQIRVYMRFSDGMIQQFDGSGWSGQLGAVPVHFVGSPAVFTTGNVQHLAAVDATHRIRYNRRNGANIYTGWQLL